MKINYRKLTSGWRWEILSETGECLQHGWSKLKSRAKIQAEESFIKLKTVGSAPRKASYCS